MMSTQQPTLARARRFISIRVLCGSQFHEEVEFVIRRLFALPILLLFAFPSYAAIPQPASEPIPQSLQVLQRFVPQNSYYVDPDGIGGSPSDSNPGTISEPWLTLQHAIQTVTAGNRIYLRAATYSMYDIIAGSTPGYRFNAATPSNPLTVEGYPGETAILSPFVVKDSTGDWTLQTGNIYYCDVIAINGSPCNIDSVKEDDVFLTPKPYHWLEGDYTDLSGPSQFAFKPLDPPSGLSRVFVWASDGANPGTHTTEIASRTEVINPGSNMIFRNLTVRQSYNSINVVYQTNILFYEVTSSGYWKDSGVRPPWASHSDGILLDKCTLQGDLAIDITGGHNWIVRNCDIRGLLLIKNNSTNVRIINNHIHDFSIPGDSICWAGGETWGGVWPEGVNIVFQSNLIENVTGGYLVTFAGSIDCSFKQNVIKNCTFNAPRAWRCITEGGQSPVGSVISGNVGSGNTGNFTEDDPLITFSGNSW